MQWIKASDHYPEGWQLGRVDGKKMPLMFAPHVIADVSGKTYKREQVEYFTDAPAPSPDLEAEAATAFLVEGKTDFGKICNYSAQAGYLKAARRYASTVEALQQERDRYRTLLDDLVNHAKSTQWIRAKPGKSLEESIEELKECYREVSDICDSAQRRGESLIEQLNEVKQENERLREALKGMVDYYIWLIGDPNFLEYRRAVDALKPKEEQ